MLKSEEMMEMIYLSDRFSQNEKGILATAVAMYRSTGEVVDFTGNERVADFFYTLIRPLIDKEKENTVRTSRARAAAGSKGGKAKAEKKANAKNVATASDQANVANVANVNFANHPAKKAETPSDRGIAVTCQHHGSTSNDLVDGGVNNNIYNTTITKDETASKNGGGGNLKKNTTITNNDPSDEGTNPKRKSVIPTVGELNLGGKPDLNSSSTTTKNNVTGTSVSGSLVSPEDTKKSSELLMQVGVWKEVTKELACTIPYSRIKANVDLKTKEYKEGKVKNLGAVVVKAVREDHAANVAAMDKLRQPVPKEIPLEVLKKAEQMRKKLD